jgi:hypothetical protein
VQKSTNTTQPVGGRDENHAMMRVTSNYLEWWLIASDCFWITALARAAGQERMATDFYIVGVDWIAGLQVRWRPASMLLN